MLWLWSCVWVVVATGTPPNILFVVADDLGHADVSYHKSPYTDIPTKNIDELALSGVRLESYYVQPVCSPTRSTFMSGRYPFHTGLQHFTTIKPGSKAAIPLKDPTIAECLEAGGYDRHAIGKWHCGMARWANTPTGRGFDSYLGYMQAEVDYYNHTICGLFSTEGSMCGYDFWANRTVDYSANGTYSMYKFIPEARRILHNRAIHNSTNPLFLYFAFQTVHVPIEPPPESSYMQRCSHIQHKGRQTFCAKVLDMDDKLGELVEMWKAAGLWDNTILIFTTDNGGIPHYNVTIPPVPIAALERQKSYSSNWPLRAGKITLHEGGVRGTAFVSGGLVPRKVRGTISHALMHSVDWMATILSAAHLSIPTTVDGYDMWDAITTLNGTSPRTDVPINLHLEDCALDSDFGWPIYNAIRVGDWKLIEGLTGPYDGWFPPLPHEHIPATDAYDLLHLYNVVEDPTEHHNVAFSQRDKVNELLERLNHYKKSYVGCQNNYPDPEGEPDKHEGVWAPFLG